MARARASKQPTTKRAGRSPGAAERATRTAHSGPPSAFHRAGPLVALGTPGQLKPKIGKPGDAFEREADTVAARAMRGDPAGPISRVTPALMEGAAQRQTVAEDQDEALQREIAEPEEDELVQNQQADEQEEPLQAQLDEPIEEEEPVQRQADAEMVEEEAPVQAQTVDEVTEGEEPVQAQAAGELAEDEEPLQRQSEPTSEEEEPIQAASRGEPTMEDAAAEAIRSRGPGEPLRPDVRERLESSFGVGLDDVRVHDDRRAQDAAGALNARAFTNRSDIWLGAGESQSDLGLMAHEATHVVQQTGSVQRQLVQLADTTAGADPNRLTSDDGTINLLEGTITIPVLRLPEFGEKASKPPKPLTIPKEYKRHTNQRDMWRKQVNVDDAVERFLPESKGIVDEASGQSIYYLKLKRRKSYIVGTRETLKTRLRLPNWTERGVNYPHDVDHIYELQLGGPHSLPNFQLLGFQANRSSGARIAGEIRKRISKAVKPHTGPNKHWQDTPDPDVLRKNYKVTFERIESDLPIKGPHVRWTPEDVRQGKHFEALEILDADDVERANLRGSPTRLTIYTSRGAGKPKKIGPWDPSKSDKQVSRKNWARIKGFDLVGVSYTLGSGGSLSARVFDRNRTITGKLLNVAMIEESGLQYTLRTDTASIRAAMRNLLSSPTMSPIEIYEATLDEDAIRVSGVLRPSLPFFRDGIEIDIAAEGDDVMLSKTFSASDFNFPGPVQVTSSDLTVTAGSGGIEATGNLEFEVERVGRGTLSGATSSSGKFGVAGAFDFDSSLFNPAQIKLSYEDDKFGGGGELGIKPDTVRGIKSAKITATIDGESWKAEGTVEPDVPGIKSGTLEAAYNPETGFEIGGSLVLGDDIPAVKSGTLEAKLKPRPDEEGYALSASGDIVLDIPGVDASVNASYDDGAFTAAGTVAYEKGMLEGAATFGVTNRAIADGQPTEEATDKLTAFGSGLVTIQIAPWLEGRVGITLLPNGEIEVSGSIGLPDAIDIFPEKSLDKNILRIGVDIPIVGVAAAGQRIGIFANVSGSLDARAAIGPGQLREVDLSVKYNPDRESETTVTGNASFVVPASAGLRLAVRGSLGAGIPVVSASAGLEVGGELGLEGEASAAVAVDWTPMRGLELNAQGRLMVQPQFTFDISGFALVELDLWLKTIELYSKRWQLASFTYGSGMQFGLIFPITYREGQPFDLSLSDIKFVYPDIDPQALISGLVKQVV